MLGAETIDLTVATPAQTEHLSFSTSSGASFSAKQGCWAITQADGYLEFSLNLPDFNQINTDGTRLIGIALSLQIRGEGTDMPGQCPAVVSLNGAALNQIYDPSPTKSCEQSWYLPETQLQAGANLITVTLAPGIGTETLLLQSLTATGFLSHSVIGFSMQQQAQTEWCWAAVGASTSSFFDGESTWTQCKLANTWLGQTTCCNDGQATACNQPWRLEDALTSSGNLASFCGGLQTLDRIRAEIAGGRPVGVRVGYKGGGGHFVILTGVGPQAPGGDDQTLITLEDPANGCSIIPYGILSATDPKNGYRGDSVWTNSYFTQKQAGPSGQTPQGD